MNKIKTNLKLKIQKGMLATSAALLPIAVISASETSSTVKDEINAYITSQTHLSEENKTFWKNYIEELNTNNTWSESFKEFLHSKIDVADFIASLSLDNPVVTGKEYTKGLFNKIKTISNIANNDASFSQAIQKLNLFKEIASKISEIKKLNNFSSRQQLKDLNDKLLALNPFDNNETQESIEHKIYMYIEKAKAINTIANNKYVIDGVEHEGYINERNNSAQRSTIIKFIMNIPDNYEQFDRRLKTEYLRAQTVTLANSSWPNRPGEVGKFPNYSQYGTQFYLTEILRRIVTGNESQLFPAPNSTVTGEEFEKQETKLENYLTDLQAYINTLIKIFEIKSQSISNAEATKYWDTDPQGRNDYVRGSSLFDWIFLASHDMDTPHYDKKDNSEFKQRMEAYLVKVQAAAKILNNIQGPVVRDGQDFKTKLLTRVTWIDNKPLNGTTFDQKISVFNNVYDKIVEIQNNKNLPENVKKALMTQVSDLYTDNSNYTNAENLLVNVNKRVEEIMETVTKLDTLFDQNTSDDSSKYANARNLSYIKEDLNKMKELDPQNADYIKKTLTLNKKIDTLVKLDESGLAVESLNKLSEIVNNDSLFSFDDDKKKSDGTVAPEDEALSETLLEIKLANLTSQAQLMKKFDDLDSNSLSPEQKNKILEAFITDTKKTYENQNVNKEAIENNLKKYQNLYDQLSKLDSLSNLEDDKKTAIKNQTLELINNINEPDFVTKLDHEIVRVDFIKEIQENQDLVAPIQNDLVQNILIDQLVALDNNKLVKDSISNEVKNLENKMAAIALVKNSNGITDEDKQELMRQIASLPLNLDPTENDKAIQRIIQENSTDQNIINKYNLISTIRSNQNLSHDQQDKLAKELLKIPAYSENKDPLAQIDAHLANANKKLDEIAKINSNDNLSVQEKKDLIDALVNIDIFNEPDDAFKNQANQLAKLEDVNTLLDKKSQKEALRGQIAKINNLNDPNAFGNLNSVIELINQIKNNSNLNDKDKEFLLDRLTQIDINDPNYETNLNKFKNVLSKVENAGNDIAELQDLIEKVILRDQNLNPELQFDYMDSDRERQNNFNLALEAGQKLLNLESLSDYTSEYISSVLNNLKDAYNRLKDKTLKNELFDKLNNLVNQEDSYKQSAGFQNGEQIDKLAYTDAIEQAKEVLAKGKFALLSEIQDRIEAIEQAQHFLDLTAEQVLTQLNNLANLNNEEKQSYQNLMNQATTSRQRALLLQKAKQDNTEKQEAIDKVNALGELSAKQKEYFNNLIKNQNASNKDEINKLVSDAAKTNQIFVKLHENAHELKLNKYQFDNLKKELQDLANFPLDDKESLLLNLENLILFKSQLQPFLNSDAQKPYFEKLADQLKAIVFNVDQNQEYARAFEKQIQNEQQIFEFSYELANIIRENNLKEYQEFLKKDFSNLPSWFEEVKHKLQATNYFELMHKNGLNLTKDQKQQILKLHFNLAPEVINSALNNYPEDKLPKSNLWKWMLGFFLILIVPFAIFAFWNTRK
ncbi:hypothetical protein [Mycoplasmopsis gallopavonis]|uniref:ECM-binding protein homolog n=1 Tax=Mycoplasmopsis gallopavonis TaxID=76629 RepID=A0A449AZZ6_9BACT|nr:hypothetical protein [Mycoplasmopsis gallopavonis]RIV16628.1 hypothetical protein D1113_01675 [Mycoplasmopsis gallopavonis]VEU73064.1 Uncharacterised protein [Mycoplasmopsis gallopavonis]